MNIIVQVKCSPKSPLKAQTIFGEFMPCRKKGIRIRIMLRVHTRRIFFFSGKGNVIDLNDLVRAGNSQQEHNACISCVSGPQPDSWPPLKANPQICAFWQVEKQKECSLWLKVELSGVYMKENLWWQKNLDRKTCPSRCRCGKTANSLIYEASLNNKARMPYPCILPFSILWQRALLDSTTQRSNKKDTKNRWKWIAWFHQGCPSKWKAITKSRCQTENK